VSLGTSRGSRRITGVGTVVLARKGPSRRDCPGSSNVMSDRYRFTKALLSSYEGLKKDSHGGKKTLHAQRDPAKVK